MNTNIESSSVVQEVDMKTEISEESSKLSFSTKLSYGLGDFASNLFWGFGGSYLTIFYTDQVGIAPAVAGMIILIARLFDGLNDPLMGYIADRTKSKHGRFRPYILYGTPLLALFSVLTFTAPGFGGSMDAKIAWAFFTYVGLGVFYTMVNLPYGSLAAVMSKDTGERTALSSYRMFFTQIGTILLSAISMPLILFFSRGTDGEISTNGYTMAAIIFAIIAIPMFYLLFFKSKEVVQPINEDRPTIKQTVHAIFTSKSMILVFTILLISLTGFFGRLGVHIYYYRYVLERMDLVAILMPLPAIGAGIGIMLFTRLAKNVGKKNMLYISYTLSALSLICLYFVNYSNIPLVMILTFLFGLMQFGIPIVMAMIPDVIDEIEDKRNVRIDGTAYAATSLSTKFASAIGGSVTLVLLGYVGYVANVQQTPEAMDGINLVVNIFPAILFLVCMIPVKMYDLTDEKVAEIGRRLDEKR